MKLKVWSCLRQCSAMMNASEGFQGQLVDFVTRHMVAFEDTLAPGLVLPKVDAAHLVGDDAQVDLLFMIGMLIDLGLEQLAGVDLRDRAQSLLATIDPMAIEGFFAYRVAESVHRIGGLASLEPSLRSRIAYAAQSPRLVADLVRGVERKNPNFVVVAARCLHSASIAGVEVDPAVMATIVERARGMFESSETGWINDGKDGHVQFDIYTPEMYLLAEPLSGSLGDVWGRGFARLMRDLDDVWLPSGAVVWGRSIGALAQAMTIELAAIVQRERVEGCDDWSARADVAFRDLDSWFSPSGLVLAHQGRSSDGYRGPARRLQMTLDLYGKLLYAALEWPRVGAPESHPAGRSVDRDRLVVFDPSTTASAWTYRSRSIDFVLPLLFGRTAEYLPSPRSPGLLEQPVDGFPVMLPTVSVLRVADDGSPVQVDLVPSGLPTEVHHTRASLKIRHEGWAPIGATADGEHGVDGSRTAVYRIVGRTIEVHERLHFAEPIDGVLSLSIAERSDRPLDLGGDGPALVADVSGLPEWRSYWGEPTRVHQFNPTMAPEVTFRWSVTPRLRVASTDAAHQYYRSLYAPMDLEVVPIDPEDVEDSFARRLRGVDVLHLGWPERWSGLDPDRTAEIVQRIKHDDVRIVWTQHNLLPHRDKSAAAARTYEIWAKAADAVIHHSEYGKHVALAAYQYGPHTRHVVIPHGHWGSYYTDQVGSREEIENEEGWGPTPIRLAILGQPRPQKDLQMVVDAVARCDRDDLQLVARLSSDIQVPPDRRIVAEYGHLDANRYHRRMAAFDGVIFPFRSDGMLTTGTVFDSIGAGVAAITSEWPFLDEVLGSAAIRYGSSENELVDCLNGLTGTQLRLAGEAIAALRPQFEWATIARRTEVLLEEVCA